MKYPVQIPFILKYMFPHILWQGDKQKKYLYLTFDDGPSHSSTERLLTLLSGEKVKATFFCRGDRSEKHAHLLGEIRKAGHIIGHHSFSHPNGLKTPSKEYLRDVQKSAKILNSPLFRPPYGKLTIRQYLALRKMGQKIVLWTVMPGDFDPQVDSNVLLRRMNKHLREGAIYVLHDHKKTIEKLEEVLPVFIQNARERGYEFRTIEI
jgi:peptidoglycan/xylan/chitin deacetylase (PgdA/CDA1 family)